MRSLRGHTLAPDDDDLIFTDTAEEANTRSGVPRPGRTKESGPGQRGARRAPPATGRRPPPTARHKSLPNRRPPSGRIPSAGRGNRRDNKTSRLKPIGGLSKTASTHKVRRPPPSDVAASPHCLLSAVLSEPIQLSRSQRYVVGRDESADVRIRTDKVSRRHAEIWWDGTCFVVCDKASTNGSTINDHTLGLGATPIHDGDRLGFGGYEVVVAVLEPGELPDMELGGGTRRIRLPPKSSKS
jgi:hypothetical protein